MSGPLIQLRMGRPTWSPRAGSSATRAN